MSDEGLAGALERFKDLDLPNNPEAAAMVRDELGDERFEALMRLLERMDS